MGSLLDPRYGGPQPVGGEPTTIQIAEVVAINAAGTIDAKLLTSRAVKAGIVAPSWWAPKVGERCLLASRDGDPQVPICLGFYAAQDGSLTGPTLRYPPTTDWTAITAAKFVSPWTNDGGFNEEVLRYKVDALGVAHVVGKVKGQATTTAPQPITVAGALPTPLGGHPKRFMCSGSGPAGSSVSVLVWSDGSLQLNDYSGQITAWIDLSGVQYPTT